ncbi:MAG: efflux transporter, family, subunit [Flavipsychrobacter sp.]|jgi:membrane fusion protein (multidrug efflux system)|nr:efflux transporter, family, subunit [Flavipsychrobacter sp.]
MITFDENRIYCKQANIYIDPWNPVKSAIITYAHSEVQGQACLQKRNILIIGYMDLNKHIFTMRMLVVTKYFKPVLYITILFGLTSCKDGKEEKKETKKSSRPSLLVAEGIVIKGEPFQTEYTTSGSLFPNEDVEIVSEVAGRVTSISFTEGGKVTKGKPLVQLYNEDIKAQIQKSKAQRELQEKIKARQAELLRIGGISKQDYETTTAQIQSIDADIAFYEAQLRKTVIYAPFNGRIGIRNVSVGAVITPATVIATLQQTRILKMDFTVPDQYKREVPNGKVVRFTVTGSLDTFTGVISALEPTANTVTRTIKVRALVQNEDHKLVAGAFTHVVIPLNTNQNALLIPPQSVIPTDRDKKVAVVNGGKAKLVTVTIGTRTNDKVEVLKGLKEGDTVLTTGMMQVKDDMKVKVTVRG